MNIVFFGTSAFSVKSLEALLSAGHNVAAVVTKPDSGRRAAPSPVKILAKAASLRLTQPHSIRTPEFIAEIRGYVPDVIVVTAYGKILTKELLTLPPHGSVNVHASILPSYRGAAPIQRAIMAGERETGVTTMLMDEGVDTGAVFLTRKTEIGEDDTAETLTERLAALGAQLLIETLTGIDSGTLKAVAQQGNASYAPPISKDDCRINWAVSANEVVNHIRGLSPFPGAFTFVNGQRMKILRGAAVSGGLSGHTPGDVVRQDGGVLLIAAFDGLVSIEQLQPEGKRPMTCAEYIRGRANAKEALVHVG
ncbi:MAG: methionyl-tRNA formyltransferase [Candidatus Magnetominusculus sp. LBB02]|nr:methionyl-tRNA formyltransferase [Candidatus Magnetominusculus sp. LBB02]